MEESTAATTTNTAILPATLLHRPIFQSQPNQNQNQNRITIPTKSVLNLDTVSLKSYCYTSLKDVLPFTAAAVNSPTASSAFRHEISIRNPLVKQAAWAYLQPMSASPTGPSGPHFLRHRFSSVSHRRRRRNPLTTCLSFICHHLVPCFTRTFHRILHAIRDQVPILCFWLL